MPVILLEAYELSGSAFGQFIELLENYFDDFNNIDQCYDQN